MTSKDWGETEGVNKTKAQKNKNLAPGGADPTTFALLVRHSNQLSYGTWIDRAEQVIKIK